MSPKSRQPLATFPPTCSTMAFPAEPEELALSNSQERPASPTPSPVLGRGDAILGAGQGGPVANPKRHKRGAPQTLHGNSLRLNTVTSLAPWAPCPSVGFSFYGAPWGSTWFCEAPCHSVGLCMFLWGSVSLRVILRGCTGLCVIPRDFMGAPCHPVAFYGAPWGYWLASPSRRLKVLSTDQQRAPHSGLTPGGPLCLAFRALSHAPAGLSPNGWLTASAAPGPGWSGLPPWRSPTARLTFHFPSLLHAILVPFPEGKPT